MAQLPKNIPENQEFLDGLYLPEFLPRDLDLNRFVFDPDELVQKVEASADAKIAAAQRGEQAGPLTEEEAAAVDAKIDTLLGAIAATRERIAQTRSKIEEQVAPAAHVGSSGDELSFKMDISKKHTLKRAIGIVFGVKTDTITYSMYKACLEMRRELEGSEASDYTSGNWEEAVNEFS